jgi:hypothetical protein
MRRAQFLEKMVQDSFESAFPGGQVFRNIRWRDGDREYETDLLVVIDSCLIIVEAKSGTVSWPALRGASERTKRHVTDLIIEPSVQSSRLETKIRSLRKAPGPPDFFVRTLPIDFSSIWEVIRLSVTLDDFATIQTDVVQLGRTGWLPHEFEPASTFSLADLQTVLMILPSVPERLFYLVRRSELERKLPYQADEMDLLGYYLRTGFSTGDLGKKVGTLVLHGMSADVDEYMIAKDAGSTPRKPKRIMTVWWQDILAQLESSTPPRWTEAALILLTADLRAQREIEKRTKRLIRSVASPKNMSPSKNAFILLPDYSRTDALAVVALAGVSIHERHRSMQCVAEDAFSGCDASRCLILALNVESPKYPYQTLAVFEKQLL